MELKYFIADAKQPNGLREVSEAEWVEIFGEGIERTYADQVYHGEISINDVPEENCESVSRIVEKRTSLWGTYENEIEQ